MTLSRIVDPVELPVTLEEAKEHLRVTDSADDVYIRGLIKAATEHVDARNAVGRTLVTQTWRYGVQNPTSRVTLPLLPVQSLSAVKYFDEENVEQTAELSDFRLVAGIDFAYVEPISGASWPSGFDRPDAVNIEFVAGYGDGGEAIPANICQAIKLLLAHWYEHRESVAFASASEVPMGFEALLNMERRGWYG